MADPGTTIGLIALVVAAVLALAEGLKQLITYFTNKSKDEESHRYEERCEICTKMITQIHDVITRTDNSGTPLTYFPKGIEDIFRESARQQQALADKMVSITISQEKIVSCLERMERRQEYLNRN